MKNNVVLIGMPGCGKSTVGVVLAKSLGYRFLDVDLLIQEREGKLLYEIIEERGFEGFVKAEEEAILSISTEETIIATGGSAVYGASAMRHLCETGTVVYIKLSCRGIAERLGDLHQRGVVMRGKMTLMDLYEERTPLYERYAELVIDADGKELKDIVSEIKSQILCKSEKNTLQIVNKLLE